MILLIVSNKITNNMIYESSDGILFNSPDAYILSQPGRVIEWGKELKVYPVYKQGNPALYGHQTIQARFCHEGSEGSTGSTSWLPQKPYSNWYQNMVSSSNIELINTPKILRFDLGFDHPLYFKTKDDFLWYMENIYTHYLPFVTTDIDI